MSPTYSFVSPGIHHIIPLFLKKIIEQIMTKIQSKPIFEKICPL